MVLSTWGALCTILACISIPKEHKSLILFLSLPPSVLCLIRWAGSQLFKEELSPMKDGVKLVNDLAHQLAISDVHLSMENSRALEQINTRWKQLQVRQDSGAA